MWKSYLGIEVQYNFIVVANDSDDKMKTRAFQRRFRLCSWSGDEPVVHPVKSYVFACTL